MPGTGLRAAIAFVLAASYKQPTRLAMANSTQFAVRRIFKGARFPAIVAVLLAALLSASAQLNFDVFVGHGLGLSDSTVAEGSWFPVTCEIQNDGPAFNAIVEIS